MIHLLVRNRVQDFDRWHTVFVAQKGSEKEYGLKTLRLWRDRADSNQAFFLMSVESVDRAKAFMALPESEAAGVAAGVIDGDYWFLDANEAVPST